MSQQLFALRFLTPDKISPTALTLLYQNMQRNWMACHAHLFTVFAQLNAEWEFCGKACICSVFCQI